MKRIYNLCFMALLLPCTGCVYHLAHGDISLDCSKVVQQRTNFFLNYIVDEAYESPPPRKSITYLGNTISENELTQSYGKFQAPVYAKLNEMVAENDKSEVIFYKVEIFGDKTSRLPLDVVIICINEGISASGPVFFDGIFIDLDIKDYHMAIGGVWDM